MMIPNSLRSLFLDSLIEASGVCQSQGVSKRMNEHTYTV